MSQTRKSRSVAVGDLTVQITDFRGLKGLIAADLIERVSKQAPELQQELNTFITTYRHEQAIKITPAMARTPIFRELELTAEDFDGQPYIELPSDPNGQQIAIAMFPTILNLAREELFRLVALIAIPNSELEKADDDGNVTQALDDLARKLVRAGYIDELLEIVNIGITVIEEQITSKRSSLGKLMNLPFVRMLRSTPESSDTDLMSSSQTTNETQASIPDAEPSPSAQQDSSTASPEPTDGVGEQLSTESPGTNSSSLDAS